MFNKQTYSLSVLIIFLNVKQGVEEELTMICFVLSYEPFTMILALDESMFFRFAASYTQSHVCTVRRKYVCTACVGVFVCVAYF